MSSCLDTNDKVAASRGSHLTGNLASSNASSAGRSSLHPILAQIWPQDSASNYPIAPPQHHYLPQPGIRDTPQIAVSGHFLAQPSPDVYASAASSPQSDYKYYQNGYARPLFEEHISHFMNSESLETMQTPPISAHPSPNNEAIMGDQISRKRSHSAMSTQEFTQQMIAAANADSAAHSNDTRPASRNGSVNTDGGEAEGYSPAGTRAFKRGDAPKNEHGKYICEYTEDCRALTFDRKCEWR